MASFYVSPKALETLVLSKDYREMLMRHCDIYVYADNVELFNIQYDEDGNSTIIGDFVQDGDMTLNSVKEQLSELSSLKEPSNLSNAVYILPIPQEQADKIQSRYGVICQSDNNIDLNMLFRKKSVYCEIPNKHKDPYNQTYEQKRGKKDIAHDWSDILKTTEGIPCNSIVINDHYLFKDDTEESDNLLRVLDILLPKKLTDNICNILLLYDMKKDASDFGTISTNIKKRITSLRDYRMVVEFLAGDSSCKLFSYTHNRNIVTNYLIISAEHKIAAFDKGGNALADQKISYECLYSTGILDDSDTPERGCNILINRVRNIAKYGCDHDQSGYLFSQNGISNPKKISLKNIKNRLLAIL